MGQYETCFHHFNLRFNTHGPFSCKERETEKKQERAINLYTSTFDELITHYSPIETREV